MEVSVVITAYNRAEYLEEAVRSVMRQTFQDFEIIVVDDGSTDNTRELISKLANPKIRYIYQSNQGTGAARNTGLRHSRGRFIAILDADDVWLPEKLEMQIKAFKDNPKAGLVYTNMYFFGAMEPDTPETFFDLLQWPPPRGDVLENMVVRSFGHPSTQLIRKEVFDVTGPFDEKLPYCDDYDMLIRTAAYFEFDVINVPLVKYRIHPGQISRNAEHVLQDHLTVFKKTLKLPFIGKSVRKRINARTADFHFRYFILLLRQGRFLKGFRELLAVIETDMWRIFPLSLATGSRIFSFLLRRLHARESEERQYPIPSQ